LVKAFANFSKGEAVREFLVIDPDIEFARIVAMEIGEALGCAVSFRAFGDAAGPLEEDTCVLVNSAHAARIVPSIDGAPCRCIELKSMQDFVAGQQRPTTPVLIGVVSRSESVLHWSSTLLSALGFSPDAVVLRNPKQARWKDGLGTCGIVATDTVAAPDLANNIRPVVFRILSEKFLDELRNMVAAGAPDP
jgi:hypothetical protein